MTMLFMLTGSTIPGPVQAQTTNAPPLTNAIKSPSLGIWEDDVIGHGFRRGVQETGFLLGTGVSAPYVGDRTSHDLALAQIYYGWMLGSVRASDKWYRGNWEIMEDLVAGGQYFPARHYVAGEATFLRYNFATGTRWMPFLDGGVGILGTDIGHPDLGTIFEFDEQIGPGINYFWRKNSALSFEYRFTHISNAGIKPPNQGVNEHMFYVGLTWYF
jgi:hypothetical protein